MSYMLQKKMWLFVHLLLCCWMLIAVKNSIQGLISVRGLGQMRAARPVYTEMLVKCTYNSVQLSETKISLSREVCREVQWHQSKISD